jgi:hypothetical protein
MRPETGTEGALMLQYREEGGEGRMIMCMLILPLYVSCVGLNESVHQRCHPHIIKKMLLVSGVSGLTHSDQD